MSESTAPVLTGPEKGSEWTTDRSEILIPLISKTPRVSETGGLIPPDSPGPMVYVYRLENFYFINKEDGRVDGFRNFRAWVLADVRER